MKEEEEGDARRKGGEKDLRREEDIRTKIYKAGGREEDSIICGGNEDVAGVDEEGKGWRGGP